MIKKLKKFEVRKCTNDALTLNKIERMVQKYAGGDTDRYVYVLNILRRNLTIAEQNGEVS